MATFFQFQRVRIVSLSRGFEKFIGAEVTLMGRTPLPLRVNGVNVGFGWMTDLPHPNEFGSLDVAEFQIEPLTYTPDAEDLAWREGGPDFRIVRPDYFPADPVMVPGVVP